MASRLVRVWQKRQSLRRDPFRDYWLSEAVLELRRGVGRLIRTKQDKGIVVILHPRILTKSYGSAFLRALPKCPVEVV